MVDEIGHHVGAQAAGCDGKIRIKHSAIPAVVHRGGRVETRPEHPEENGAQQGEEVVVMSSEFELVEVIVRPLFPVDGAGQGQPKNAPKRWMAMVPPASLTKKIS